jgi:hypothetical protein
MKAYTLTLDPAEAAAASEDDLRARYAQLAADIAERFPQVGVASHDRHGIRLDMPDYRHMAICDEIETAFGCLVRPDEEKPTGD